MSSRRYRKERLFAAANSTGTIIATYDRLNAALGDQQHRLDNGTLRTRFRYTALTTSAMQTLNDATGAVIRSIANDWTGEHLMDWPGSDQRIYGTNLHHDVTWTGSSSAAVSATLRHDAVGQSFRVVWELAARLPLPGIVVRRPRRAIVGRGTVVCA
jgi:hypothetical protein